MLPGQFTRLKGCDMSLASVRFGSLADICAAKSHVRFTLESGHLQRTRPCLLWANSGHSNVGRDFVGI
jgi:hypothetical protein